VVERDGDTGGERLVDPRVDQFFPQVVAARVHLQCGGGDGHPVERRLRGVDDPRVPRVTVDLAETLRSDGGVHHVAVLRLERPRFPGQRDERGRRRPVEERHLVRLVLAGVGDERPCRIDDAPAECVLVDRLDLGQHPDDEQPVDTPAGRCHHVVGCLLVVALGVLVARVLELRREQPVCDLSLADYAALVVAVVARTHCRSPPLSRSAVGVSTD
jgi:hypothetical protein